MPRLSAAEAAAIIQEDQRNLTRAVYPKTISRLRRLMQEETLCICNVGPWAYHIDRGSITVDIPAYDPKKHENGYAKSEPMPELRRETKLTGGGGDQPLEYDFVEDDGRQVAWDLIGVGFGLHPHNSLVQYGVFVPEGKIPTKAELDEARRNLSESYDRLIEEARDAYDKGPETRKAVISDRHLLAARAKGMHEAWVHHQHTQQSVQCAMCGKFNPEGIAKCACGQIIDVDLYRRLQAQQEEMVLDAATRPAAAARK